MAEEHGMGAIQSPPDDRDWMVAGAVAHRLAGTTPASFLLGNRPPVTNQLDTPQCVAYSTGVEQNWQDRVEHGRFFDFNEGAFFARIGGTVAGAVARNALNELLNVGYPEADLTPDAKSHQCASYVRIEQSVQAVKDAIIAFGGVLVVGPWFANWTERHGDKQVLPPPSGQGTGHEWWGVGWDEYGLIGQNSWGTLWGDQGLFRMPWYYVVAYMWEVWATVDERTTEKLDRYFVVNGPEINIRRTPPDSHDPKNVFAVSRDDGIYRKGTGNRIGPLRYPFRFLHWHDGPDGRWAVGRGFRRRLAVRKSLMHFVKPPN